MPLRNGIRGYHFAVKEIPFIKSSDLKTSFQCTETLVENIKSARLSKGWSIRELATKAGCSHVHLLKIERGEKQPTTRLATRLQCELGLSPILVIRSNTPNGKLTEAGVIPHDEEIISLPRGPGTVVALLVDALVGGGYKPTLTKPCIEDRHAAAIVNIEIGLGADGKMTIPIHITK